MKKIVIIDGHSLLYRAYFAMIRNPLYNSEGQNTSAIVGFLNMYFKILSEFNPDGVCVVYDKVKAGYRKELYPEYKANRAATPDELKSQFVLFEEMLDLMNIPAICDREHEGDDLIGSIVYTLKDNKDVELFVVTGDKDIFQVLHFADNVNIVLTKKGISNIEIYNSQRFFDEYCFEPYQIIDFKSLTGDKSDNIPGVKGIGDKTATDLIVKFKTLENIYNNLDNIKDSVRKKLEIDKEKAFISYKLASIIYDFNINYSLEDLLFKKNYKAGLKDFLKKLSIRSIMNKFKFEEDEVQELEEKTKIIKTDYKIITSKEDFNKVLKDIKEKAEIVAFDTETTSLELRNQKIVGLSFCFEETKAFYIPLSHFYLGVPDQLSRDYVLKNLINVLNTKKIIGHNIKFDMLVLKKYGFDLKPYFDTSIAHYVLYPESGHSIDYIAQNMLDVNMKKFTELIPRGNTMENCIVEDAAEYACADADICLRLYNLFEKELLEKNLASLFYNIEMPLVKILAEMEFKGISLNSAHLNCLEKEFDEKINILQKEIFELSGEEFNIDSPKQLSYILFEKLGLQPLKKIKTGFSTDASVLEKMAIAGIPIAKQLLDYRNATKLLNTYIKQLPEIVDSDNKIHSSFNQTVTTTGRLSSSNPNLQNIPNRSWEGKEIRKAFIADKGKTLYSFDYSQIELRVLAHISDDKVLIEAFRKGKDVHSITASGIFHVDIADVTEDMRRVAKTVNFGVIYGMNAYGLASRLNIENSEAKNFINSLFEKYTKVAEFIENQHEKVKKDKIVITEFGRIRNLSGFNKSIVDRMAVNTPVQGTAADIMKIAMIKVFDKLELAVNKDVSLLIQIHDELVFEINDNVKDKELIIKNIVCSMEDCVKLSVPLRVDIKYGKNLGEMENLAEKCLEKQEN
ncbi:MAG: DNA polymerase I [Candidatus Muirbacterium halophilum]|nr:DNA polymerase I [Candidatus Muirbacterium halophilum]MCK9476178.1 DNA polymerase I [Candidatus Muirbacterium halophilum]